MVHIFQPSEGKREWAKGTELLLESRCPGIWAIRGRCRDTWHKLMHSPVLVAFLSLSPLVEVVRTFLGIREGKASFGDLREDPQCSGWSTRQVGGLLLPCGGWMSGGWRKAEVNGKPRDVTKDSSQAAQSSLGSKKLLVLDLKAKNP